MRSFNNSNYFILLNNLKIFVRPILIFLSSKNIPCKEILVELIVMVLNANCRASFTDILVSKRRSAFNDERRGETKESLLYR